MNFATAQFSDSQKKQQKHSIFNLKQSPYLFLKKKPLELLITFSNFNKNEKTFKSNKN